MVAREMAEEEIEELRHEEVAEEAAAVAHPKKKTEGAGKFTHEILFLSSA